MEDQRISYETAKLAKEKGFTTPLTSYSEVFYSSEGKLRGAPYRVAIEEDELEAPTQSLLQKWLREKHRIYVESLMYIEESLYKFEFLIKTDRNYELYIEKEENNFSSYEKALEGGLFESLKLI